MCAGVTVGACDIDISIYLSEYDSYVCMTTGRVIELHVDCQIARCEDGRGLLRHLAPRRSCLLF